jgi:hypothetical protein
MPTSVMPPEMAPAKKELELLEGTVDVMPATRRRESLLPRRFLALAINMRRT